MCQLILTQFCSSKVWLLLFICKNSNFSIFCYPCYVTFFKVLKKIKIKKLLYFKPSLISPLKLDTTSAPPNAVFLAHSPSWLRIFFASVWLISPVELFATSDAIFFICPAVIFIWSIMLFVVVGSYPYTWRKLGIEITNTIARTIDFIVFIDNVIWHK